MADPSRRRLPGGALPPHLARTRKPESNGHGPDRPLGLRRGAWEDVDDEDDTRLAAERVTFQRVADLDPGVEVRPSGRPSASVIVGVLVLVGLVVLAVVLYRMAPP
jgi:hypothetical protein